ncbi:hypothetical protein [Methanomethylovorans sp.]|uniref:hypothetical protein n=1 Tax=Methanomethylovorans sp. TaxID=2758717 RepID=UPI00351BFB99
MLEKHWLLFLAAGIGLIVVEHTTLGIGLSFVGFALARHKEDHAYMGTGSIDIWKHESIETHASIQ